MAENPGGLNASIVGVRGLTRRFGDRTILDRIDLNIRRGEFVAMLGRSGSGKSTFLRALAGLDHEVAGGGSLAVPDRLSVVFQDARLLPWKRLVENVTFGLTVKRPQERAREALAEVGLAGRERAWPQELSGGEQQRVALARALAGEPELLLADEPFGALDALTRLRMHALLRRLCERHRPAVLLVTHDVDEAIHLADRVVVLDQGKLVVDVTVALPATQPRREARVVELRERLLASLGVEAELGEKARAVA